MENYLFYLIPVLLIAVILQGTWIFIDADKRGYNHWLWGFFGLLNTPSNLLIYLLVTRLIIKGKPCNNCKLHVNPKKHQCPNCGKPLEH